MPTEAEEVLALLRNIQGNQLQSLAMQRESLELQRTAVEATLSQFSRAEAIQAKAEQIQARSAEIMASGRHDENRAADHHYPDHLPVMAAVPPLVLSGTHAA